MSASPNVDVSNLKSKTAWIQDAAFRDVSGSMTLTAQESRTVSSHLSVAKQKSAEIRHFLDDLSEAQQLLLSYDYLRSQAGQGGFIQFLVNGYVELLPPMPAWMQVIGAVEMGKVIDDVLKLFVLHHKRFKEEMSNEEFARMYGELIEFEWLDERFRQHDKNTVELMMEFARRHPGEFVDVD